MATTDPVLQGDLTEMAAWADLIAAAPPTVVERLGLAHAVEAGVHRVSAPPVPQGLFNRVVGLDHAPRTDDDLDHLLAWARAASPDPWIQVAERDERLRARLAARGLVPTTRPTWAKVVRDTSPCEAQTTLEVLEVEPEQAPALATVLAAAHGLPPFVAGWVAGLVGRPRWHAFATRDAGTIVGGGFLYCDGATAWLGLGGTAPTHRRRGGQRAVFAARIARAAALGAHTCVTETGEAVDGEPNPSLANMLRVGFRKVSARHNLHWPR